MQLSWKSKYLGTTRLAKSCECTSLVALATPPWWVPFWRALRLSSRWGSWLRSSAWPMMIYKYNDDSSTDNNNGNNWEVEQDQEVCHGLEAHHPERRDVLVELLNATHLLLWDKIWGLVIFSTTTGGMRSIFNNISICQLLILQKKLTLNFIQNCLIFFLNNPVT